MLAELEMYGRTLAVTERSTRITWANVAWNLEYDGGRFYAVVYDRNGFTIDGDTIDPRVMGAEFRDGATLEYTPFDERVTLRRRAAVPPPTLPCPRCTAEITPKRILYGYPASWVTLAQARGLVALGGCTPGGPRYACPACHAQFDTERDVLLPSLYAVHEEHLRQLDDRRGTIVVEVDGTTLEFVDDKELLVGREGHLVLDHPSVAAKHARIVYVIDRGEFWIAELLGEGTSINGTRIERPTRFADGDAVTIGPFTLRVTHRG